MRRSQTTRHHPRPSIALAADDLGVLREGDETNEDVLRRQLLDKDRENDKLRDQIQSLQNQLAVRPSAEQFQAYEAERKDLELILTGSQRENERCMAELERAKTRIQLLERELARLAGENWQSALDISPSAPFPSRNPRLHHHRTSTISSIASSIISPSSHSPSSSPAPYTNSPRGLDAFADLSSASNTFFANPDSTMIASSGQQVDDDERPPDDAQQRHVHPAIQSREATLAHIESIRLLVLGIEQRLQTREEKLVKTVEKAENEGKKFEALRQELVTNGK
ncbi:hypothetical protein AX17_000656 [Amanita inopinata Kibby_2008]|nr:hypothetical protein AX17_000656 [Amanita inopinata Kibby_2008]